MTAAVIVTAIAALFLVGIIVKTLWNSKLFWFAALALSIVLMPLTGGLSPFALFVVLLLRFYLLHKAVVTGTPRA